jgi:hypothetical protein
MHLLYNTRFTVIIFLSIFATDTITRPRITGADSMPCNRLKNGSQQIDGRRSLSTLMDAIAALEVV